MGTLAQRLRHIRTERAFTPEALDALAEIASGTTARIEAAPRAKAADAPQVAKLAAALAVPIEWLQSGDGPAPSGGRIYTDPDAFLENIPHWARLVGERPADSRRIVRSRLRRGSYRRATTPMIEWPCAL